VLGRADEAISTGGLTVMPGPVEAVLSRHPAVTECVVFGVPDDRFGQRVVAAIVADPTAHLPTVDELRDFVALSLNPTAAPRELHVLAELPRRGIGKVDRRALRERYSDVTNP
jgi:O-succinylbenzoic acid--CoA ligase